MRTIFTCKVYVSLDFDSVNDSRVIGWWSRIEDALTGLGNFGDECKWSYAVIEEFREGFHPETKQATWMKYDDMISRWCPLLEHNGFTNCINHAIG